MFKSIGKAFTKMFTHKPKASEFSMEQAKAIASKEQDKKAEKTTVQLPKFIKKDIISKQDKNLVAGHRSNTLSRDVEKLELSKRTIRPFGNFRSIQHTWYYPQKVKK